jgi:YgiT-type zinc finger domain-containing protein
MTKCDVCGNTAFHEERVEEIFRIGGQMVMVEHIPARVCDRCGDATFDRETVEQVRRTVHAGNRPVRRVNLDVFAFV